MMTITAGGTVTRQAIADIRTTGRATQGVIVQKLRDDDDRIAADRHRARPGRGRPERRAGAGTDAPDAAVAEVEALADDSPQDGCRRRVAPPGDPTRSRCDVAVRTRLGTPDGATRTTCDAAVIVAARAQRLWS